MLLLHNKNTKFQKNIKKLINYIKLYKSINIIKLKLE